MKRFLYSKVALITDLTAEAKVLIESYKNSKSINGNIFARVRQLGIDLANNIYRPDFIQEVFNQLAVESSFFVITAAYGFADALTLDQIGKLLQDRQGSLLLDNIQIFLNPANNTKASGIDVNQLKQVYLKIESVRVPVIINDPRPYMGDMVGKDEDLGIDPNISCHRKNTLYIPIRRRTRWRTLAY